MPSPQDYSQNAEQFHNEGGMPSALGHGVRGGEPTTERERQATGYAVAGDGSGAGQVKQSDSVDADEQLETFAEGDVARAVAKKAGTQRYQYQNDENDTSQSGDLQLESLHGRGRGEVSLEANEADLERKKAQQSVAREQIKDARKMGVDVDGRGQTGPSGRQPRAEID